ncbi:MAG TPA: hypothetical protein VHO48_14915 [Anaerolineaceae bacterium]|nr:hypothetical protein [Anaerolineaceae bacterium]
MTRADWTTDVRYDWSAIFQAVWLPMLFWVVAVGGATLAGFPGVICITPLSWLMGINVGQRSVQFSRNLDTIRKLKEAAIGGVLLGAFNGLLAALVVALASPLGIGADTATNVLLTTLILSLMVGGFGVTVCAGLAVFFGRQLLRKMEEGGRR